MLVKEQRDIFDFLLYTHTTINAEETSKTKCGKLE